MSPFIKKISDSFSKVSPKDLIYPGIVLLFAIFVGVIFILATRFIANNIDTAFSGSVGESSSSLNMENYTLVTRKLGVSAVVNEVTPAPVATAIPSDPQTTTTMQILDKKTLTLNILNSTKKSGLAGTLATSLESAGFSKATTGNEKTLYSTTTIVIKDGKKAFGATILEEVKKLYPDATLLTTPDTAQYDIRVIIGSK